MKGRGAAGTCLQMALPSRVAAYRYILGREGDNDGLVSVASARWGDFRGIVGRDRGISLSHASISDAPDLSGQKSRFDVPAFYVSVVSELRRLGY